MSQRIALGLTLLAALFATACGDDPKPQPGAATLVFRSQPGSVRAGEKLGDVEVALVDSSGNVLTDRSGTVQLSLTDAPEGAKLGGATRGVLNYGVARFTNLTVTKAATGMKLSAQLASQTAASAPFTVRPAVASSMSVTTGPTEVEAGAVLAPVAVTLHDAYGNIPEEVSTVTVSLEGGSAGVSLTGNLTAQTVNGVATFSELAVDEDGDYVLAFASGSMAPARSASFKIRPAQAVSLSFTTQPAASTVAGTALAAVKVSLLDARGKVAKKAVGTVSLELVSGNGATLGGTATTDALSGVATFETLRIEKAGSGYTLRASSGSLTAVDSSAFAIAPAAAARLAYVTAPVAATAGSAISPAVQVELLDTYGNRAASTATVDVALADNPGNATLGGTHSVAAVDGLATFANLTLDKAAQGYTLRATSEGVTPVTSEAFNVAHGTVAALAFTTQPATDTPAAESLGTIQVTASDAFGNVVTASTATVSVALGTNPGAATLGGTTQVTLSNGVASFTGLTVDKAGTGYTLSASVANVPPVTSNAFNVSEAAASVAFVAAPGNITAGVAFNPVVQVEIRDAGGNRVPSRATVSLRLANNPTSAALVGTASLAAVNGQARFTGLSMRKAGTGYTVEASAGSLPVVVSGAFNVSPAAMNQLVVTKQPPATVVAGVPMSTVVVEAADAYGNRIPTYGSSVNERISAGVDPDANPSAVGVVGTREVVPVNGVATFSDLAMTRVGSAELLFVAYNSALTALYQGSSSTITVTPGPAAAIAFDPVVAETTAGSAMSPAVQVRVTDRYGNATSGSGDVTLALAANPGHDTLQGTLTAPVTDGVATFADLVLRKAAEGYTLKARMGALTPVTSSTFAIVGAAPARVEFTAQPRSTPNGLPLNEVAVRLVDAFDNTATSVAPVTLALGNANGAVLGGTAVVNAQGGVARFGDLTVDRSGQGYVLAASSPSLVGTESSAFNVYGASLVYVDPAAGRIRLMRNPASTNTQLVLDVVAAEAVNGYGVGFNLPLDATKVRLAAQEGITAGAILSVGASAPAMAVALPLSGPLAGVLTSGISQKSAGSGAVATDTAIPVGSVLYQLRLTLAPGAEPGVVFDGANLGSGFKGLLRNKLGDDVVGSSGFGIGRLEIAADPTFTKTASR
ncbi:hypothetical protein JY651_37900 [Pyxidicoccus parkwayensis]|uniref:Big-1 domain-containing protein n=1 Tax=Pyxidicoccus parkwayensis TaxID=2813578 RepID=A0ABX7NR91_9BACT|nr:hypothetical protein [Pyxidicoccus parkwaysis]QSQ20953.1 hypothetical protein JY651_37900 [Pyxidicoccus parkwaysis]